jgi:Myc amino-terminal region
MDNPQHYQPLSHALHPPHAQYSTTPIIYDPKSTTTNRHDEDDEEEEDDDDEGMVEQQLNQNEPENHASNPASPHSRPRSVLSPVLTFRSHISLHQHNYWHAIDATRLTAR